MTKEQFEEIINFAIEGEKEAERFYTEAAEKAKWPHIKEMLLHLAREEEGHIRYLSGINISDMDGGHLDPIPDLKLSNYLVEMEYKPDMDFQNIMILAMKREERAVKLYEDLGNCCTDPKVCQLFNMMAEEERKHKFKLETEYDDTVMQEN